jgi:hypothetical protein
LRFAIGDWLDALHIKERNKQLRLQLKAIKTAHSDYVRTYRKWKQAKTKEQEMKLDFQIKKAQEAHKEASRQFRVLRWWLNFGE